MSTRIQHVSNKVATAGVSIGYTPNKTQITPLQGSLSATLFIPGNLHVSKLTATSDFVAGTIFAENLIANTITATTSLTSILESVKAAQLTATDIAVDTLTVKNYINGTNTGIVSGAEFGNAQNIKLSFVNNNKAFIFDNNNTVRIYNIFNPNNPVLLLSSYNISDVNTSAGKYAINSSNGYMYFTGSLEDIYAYYFDDSQNTFLSSAKITLGIGTDIDNLFVHNNYLYVDTSDPYSLLIYNISNPSTITFMGSCLTYGRKVFGVTDNHILTYMTILTGGNYVDTIGVIDTVNKSLPYRLNEVRTDIGSYLKHTLYNNYIYRVNDDTNLSACQIYFYNAQDFLNKPFIPTLTQITSSALPGYENLGSKKLMSGRMYITSTGVKSYVLNAYPKGISVWNYTNIYQPTSAYFWNYSADVRGPGDIIDNYQGALLTRVKNNSAVQLFTTYNANFDSVRMTRVNSDSFDTETLNTQNVNFLNSTGNNLSAARIKSVDVLPYLPIPKIILQGSTTIGYNADDSNQLTYGGDLTLERTPRAITTDLTQEAITNNNIFLEMVMFKKRHKDSHRGLKKGYTYTSPVPSVTPPWANFWNRTGYLSEANLMGRTRTNYVPVTSLEVPINLGSFLNQHLRVQQIAYLPLSAGTKTSYSYVPLICPHGSNNLKISGYKPKYPYARAYRPLYVAFRYITWTPEANNRKGQIVSGPLSPVLRIANKYFPFYTDHYQSSVKGFPVAQLSPFYINDFDIKQKLFTCSFC